MDYENPEMVKTFNGVPIIYDNQDQLEIKKLHPEDELNQVLDVTLRGRRKDIITLDYAKIHASIDLKSAHVGIADFPVNVVVDNNDVVVQGYSKSAISIAFDNIESRRFPVVGFSEGELAKPYQLIRVELEPQYITINAPTKLLSQIDKVIVPYSLSEVTSSFTLFDQPEAINREGVVLDTVEMSTDKVKVSVVVGKTVMSYVNLITAPFESKNIELVELNLNPKRVELLGPVSILDSIRSVDTEPIEIPTVAGEHTINVTLKLPEDVSIVDSSSVMVTAICEEIEERDITLSEANLSVIDSNNRNKINFKEDFSPTIKLRGITSAFEQSNRILVQVDTSGLVAGEYTINYQIILPQGLSAIDEDSLTGEIDIEITQ